MVISEKSFMECAAANAYEQIRLFRIMVSSGDDVAPNWEECDEEERNAFRNGFKTILDLLMSSTDDFTAEGAVTALHDSWIKFKMDNGWTYGPTLDTVNKTNPNFLPFSMLSKEEKKKSFVFTSAALTWIGLFGEYVNIGGVDEKAR